MVTVAAKDEENRRVTFACQATNQEGQQVISGTAEVIAPAEKISRERVALPEVKLLEKGKYYRQLLVVARDVAAIRMAVVHPVDPACLLGALTAAKEGLVVPVLVGPEAKIRAAAAQGQLDLSGTELLPTEHSHAAVEVAVRLARDGKVDALMQGCLRTEELMGPVVAAASGLRTGRRMSHVTALDVPGFPRPLFLTDAMLNIAPRLEEKRDIVQNAIDLALAVGIAEPKVAILSAVETVSPKLVSTLDAAILCKMADRGQIRGGCLDGPFGFDTAISAHAAAEKGIVSPVAGRADILVVPNVEAGNMIIKELEYLADADQAGIVLGARVPVVLMPRRATPLARLASSALALLVARRRTQASG
jgi:phosphate acetyltransferase/phosphate butyryltransferase